MRFSELCPGVLVHRGNNHCTPFFTNLCLAVEHCWFFCIGSCEPVHEDRTNIKAAYRQQLYKVFMCYVGGVHYYVGISEEKLIV